MPWQWETQFLYICDFIEKEMGHKREIIMKGWEEGSELKRSCAGSGQKEA